MTETVTDADVVESAYAVLGELTGGTLSGAAVELRAVETCRQMVGTVAGPDDPLWSVQLDIARQVLGLGGVPADELTEWLSAARSRENPAGAEDCPSASVSSLTEAHGLGNGGPDADAEGDPNAFARQVDSVDAMDTDDLADLPDEVLAEAEAAAYAVITRYRRQRQENR